MASAGTYAGVFNTTGNQNYTSASINSSFTISQATPALTLGSCVSFVYNGSSCTETATITTLNNQLSATLNFTSPNTTTIGTTTTSLSDTESAVNTYAYSFQTSGNTNYTASSLTASYTISSTPPITPPSGTVSYVNITIGSWANVSSQYVQQMINITESSFTNYINYPSDNSTANFEYTYENGTVIPAWIESNNSGVITTWLNITNTTTQVELDFLSQSTNTLSNSSTSGIGEAPQLSASYAQYDDGASVFTNYWNFDGTTLPSAFKSVVGTDGSVSVKNGLNITLSSPAWGTYVISQSTFTANQVLEADMQQTSSPATSVLTSLIWTGSSSGSTSSYAFTLSGTPVFETVCDYEQGGATFTTNWGCTFGTTYTENTNYNIAGLGITSAGDIGFTQFNYAQNNTGSSAQAITSGYIMLQTTQQTANYQWLRTRAYPPNGVMPTASFGAIRSPSNVSISPSNVNLDIPQNITLTATVSGGTSPYTYQWYNGTSAISGANSSTLTITAVSTGTYEYLVSVTDANTTTVNSTNATIVVNSALLANPITPSSPAIDNGQSITLTANPSGGTSPYTYQWYSGTSSTCSSDTAISGATSSTYSASPTTNTYYCYTVNDSATTPETNTSATNLITVNSVLSATISPSTTNTYTYLTTTLTATASNGTPPYSYQWYNDTSGTPQAISGATSSTYSVAFANAETYIFFANVKDNSQGNVNTTNATINVSLAFTQLTISPLNQSTVYPNPPSFYANATDMANDTITLNITINGTSYFYGSILNSTNTSINSSNSLFAIGNLGAGTYTAIFNASDALGSYILNQTNFTIQKATPSLSLSVPSSYTYNNINQNIIGTTNVSYAANNSDLTSNLFLNGTQVDTLSQSSDSSSLTYIQTGTNLAVNTYNYVWNTTGNQNYTSASATGSFSITQASPILLLTVPANFTYSGTNGVINFGVNDINQQVLANLEFNYSAYTLPAFDYDNVVANTTTNSTYGIPDAGIYNTTLYSEATQNYTANSTNIFWNITQAQGNAILQLNGTQANYTIYQHQTIPINASSTKNNNIQLFQNGTLISSQYNTTSPFTSITIQPNNTATINFTADSYSQNYTNATQTWFLTISSPPFQFNLTPTYDYLLSDGTLNSTSPQIFNLLNYSYMLNGSSYWGISNITVSFNYIIIQILHYSITLLISFLISSYLNFN